MTQERAAVFERTQIGVETTPGVAVAASKHLQGTSIEPSPMNTDQDFRPQGDKYVTIVANQREWTEATLRGYPSYGDMSYLLASAINTPSSITQFMDGGTPTGGYRWQFESNPTGPDNPKTLTIEQGSTVRALRYTGAIVPDLGLKFTRTSVDVSGKILAHEIQDGITLTGSPSDIELAPMLGGSFDVFFDATVGAIGTTKLGRLFDGQLQLANRYGPVWVVDSAQKSFVNTVELPANQTFTMQVEADAAGMAYLDSMRSGMTGFLRIRSIGPPIYSVGAFAGTPLTYQFTWDAAIKVRKPDKFADAAGVYAISWTLEGVHDSGWGKAFHVELVNKIAAL